MKSILSHFFILFVLSTHAFAGAEDSYCPWLFTNHESVSDLKISLREKIAKFTLSRNLRNFDLGIYEELKRKFLNDPELLPQWDLKEEDIAYTEATLIRNQLLDASELSSTDWIKRKKVFELLKSFSISDQVSIDTINKVAKKLRKIGASPAPSFGFAQNNFRVYAENEAYQLKLKEAIQSIDRLQPTSAVRESINRFLNDRRWQWSFTILTNLSIAKGYLGYLPAKQWVHFEEDELRQVFEDGIDQHWEKLYNKYLKTYRKDLTYQIFRKAFLSAAYGILLFHFAEGFYLTTEETNQHLIQIENTLIQQNLNDSKLIQTQLNMSDSEMLEHLRQTETKDGQH